MADLEKLARKFLLNRHSERCKNKTCITCYKVRPIGGIQKIKDMAEFAEYVLNRRKEKHEQNPRR